MIQSLMLNLKKSQIAVEFMIFSGIAIVLSIIFIYLAFDQTKDLYLTKEDLLVKDVALKVQNEISITSYVANGYYKEFELPEKINNKDYRISIMNNSLTVSTDSATHAVRILDITGYFEKKGKIL